jgi:beta propeller repeat protein
METDKKLYSIALVSTILILFITFLSTASASSSSPVNNQLTLAETRVTTSGTAEATFAIYGDKIAWTDLRNGSYDIYMYDLLTSKETRITTSGSAYDPDIYGDRIVWMDWENDIYNIYMYDISTARETQITTRGTAAPPAIYGDRIVWVDWRNGLAKKDIYMYNISTSTETRLTTSGSSKSDPDIYGNKIVWVDGRNGNSDIYMYDLSTSSEKRINSDGADQIDPEIYGNRIVWTDRNGNWSIHMYNLSSSVEIQITSNGSGQAWPDIYGDRIVYRDCRNGNPDVYMYDLSTSTETQITTNESIQDYPKIYGDRILWWNDGNGTYDLYMCTVTGDKQEPIYPAAKFSTNVTTGYVPLVVQFTDLSTNATKWSWDFGDEATSTEQNPTHIYSAGTYTVNLTASNGNGTDSKTATISVLKATPTITWNNPTDIIYGTPLSSTQLNAVASVPGTFIYTLSGGTILSAGRHTLHVDFTPIDTANYSNASKDVMINVSEQPVLPVADFLASSTTGNAPLVVAFTDKSTGTPTEWKWSFGDGSALVTQYNPTYTYTKPGTYTVKETVSNAAGKDTEIKTNYITVKTVLIKPAAAFSASPTSGYAPLKVAFTDKSTGTPTLWKWSFGNGTYSTTKNSAHTYSKAGKYTISLTATNKAGSNTATKSSYIVVSILKAPVASFSASSTSGKAPLKVQFTDKSTNSPTSWKWSFGDGTYSTSKSPAHTYSKAGKYSVSLIAKNAKGSNTKTMSGYIVVSK